jgi:hypothetical protein
VLDVRYEELDLLVRFDGLQAATAARHVNDAFNKLDGVWRHLAVEYAFRDT